MLASCSGVGLLILREKRVAPLVRNVHFGQFSGQRIGALSRLGRAVGPEPESARYFLRAFGHSRGNEAAWTGFCRRRPEIHGPLCISLPEMNGETCCPMIAISFRTRYDSAKAADGVFFASRLKGKRQTALRSEANRLKSVLSTRFSKVDAVRKPSRHRSANIAKDDRVSFRSRRRFSTAISISRTNSSPRDGCPKAAGSATAAFGRLRRLAGESGPVVLLIRDRPHARARHLLRELGQYAARVARLRPGPDDAPLRQFGLGHVQLQQQPVGIDGDRVPQCTSASRPPT